MRLRYFEAPVVREPVTWQRRSLLSQLRPQGPHPSGLATCEPGPPVQDDQQLKQRQ